MFDLYTLKCIARRCCNCCGHSGHNLFCYDHQIRLHYCWKLGYRYILVYSAFGFALFNIVFWVSLVNVFFVRSPMISLVIAWAMGIVYTIYLLVDTQLLLGGKKKSLSLDNYALGAVIIYTDIIQLFLQILKVLGEKKKEKWLNSIFYLHLMYFLYSLFEFKLLTLQR